MTVHASSPDAPRVLHVVLSLAPGGAERTVVDLVTRSEGAVRNAVCCLDLAGDWAERVTSRGVPISVLGRAPGFHPSLGLRLARAAEAHGATVLHCHQYSPFVYGQIAKLVRPSLRVIYTEQGRLSDAGPSSKRRAVNRVIGRLPAGIYAVSEDLRQTMIQEGFPPRRVGVIPNAVEPGSRPDGEMRRAARARLGVSDGAFLVGTAARFDPVKSLPTLVDAFVEVIVALPEARLCLVGDGSERTMLEEMVDARGLRASVLFTGLRADVRHLLPGFDVYVNCSIFEGTSLTIMEAMAAALPVVATNVGGNPEVVAEGLTGLLVPSRSSSSLAAALVRLGREDDLAARFGDAGRKRMEEHFAVDRIVERYVRLYRGEDPS
jgi:L-malate glycosyltransferase